MGQNGTDEGKTKASHSKARDMPTNTPRQSEPGREEPTSANQETKKASRKQAGALTAETRATLGNAGQPVKTATKDTDQGQNSAEGDPNTIYTPLPPPPLPEREKPSARRAGNTTSADADYTHRTHRGQPQTQTQPRHPQQPLTQSRWGQRLLLLLTLPLPPPSSLNNHHNHFHLNQHNHFHPIHTT